MQLVFVKRCSRDVITNLYIFTYVRGDAIEFVWCLMCILVDHVLNARDSLHAVSISLILFHFYEQDQYRIRGQILKSVTSAEPSPGL